MINLPPLIEALKNPSLYDHAVEKIEVVETHISWILLTGEYAYKIKKPVDLGFVDFSTLEKRHFYCQEELRLNRRLAPSLYLDLAVITGSENRPALDGAGPVIEYAVRMRQFDRNQELDRVLERGELRKEHLDDLAIELAEFHDKAEVTRKGSFFGDPERIAGPMRDNFIHIHKLVKDPEDLARIDRLRTWTEETLRSSREILLMRKQSGFIRECHGDLHLANMVLMEGRIIVFDCLEFNEDLRFIDVMSDLAFLLMDLDDRGRSNLANRFLNLYLEAGGDYAGISVLRLYRVYRAMVRAKVAAIRLSQKILEPGEEEHLWQEHKSYVLLAEHYIRPLRNFLILTYGLSGAGKSVLTEQIAEIIGAIRIRTDVERKRIAGIPRLKPTSSQLAQGLYTSDMTRRTYERLRSLALDLLRAGYSVILDGTFLRQEERKKMIEAAGEVSIPFVILEVRASESELRKRIYRRMKESQDPSEANLEVLNWQIKTMEPLTPEEHPFVLKVDTGSKVDFGKVVEDLSRMISS